MMQRQHLHYNMETRYYEIVEKGITYQMSLTEMHLLKKATEPTVADWYANQPAEIRNNIIRLGLPPKSADPFYPDPDFTDY